MSRSNQPGSDHSSFRGVLLLMLLRMLDGHESYGYELVTGLTDAGFDGVGEGTVYPTLNRLDREGIVSSRLVPSDKGPARKYYTLTAAGSGHRDVLEHKWARIVTAVPPIDSVSHAPEENA